MLDGYLEMGAHRCREIGDLISLRYLVRPRAVTNWFFFSPKCTTNVYYEYMSTYQTYTSIQGIWVFLDNAVQLYHCYSVDNPLYYILPGVCSTVSDPGAYGQDSTLKES